MAGVEAFTVLAVLDARDRISAVMERVDATLNGFSSSATRAAESARVAGTSIDASLLQTASGANALSVANARLSASNARLTLATTELAAAERGLIAADDVAARAAHGDTAAMVQQSAAAERLVLAQRMVARTTAEVSAAQASQAATASAAAAATAGGAAATSRFSAAAVVAGGSLQTMGKIAMGVGAAAAAIGYASVKAAASFETLTMRLVTTAGESKSNLELVRKGILDVSSSVGVSADEAAKGMYMIESAGYRAGDGIKVLRAVTEGAAIEGADFATVANAVTDVLKDYHWGASKASGATSTLVAAVSYGKTTFQNMSAAMANVLPLASALHIKINDVTGVLAEMTAHGMSAQRASFNIANAMRSLSSPTGMMSKELKLFGLSAHDVQASLGTRGLGGTLQWLSDVAKSGSGRVGQTYNEALKKLVGTATGLQVALLTTGENAKSTNAAIAGIGAAMTKSSEHVHGFSELQATMAYKMDAAKTAIHNTGIAIGSALLPAVTRIAGVITNMLIPIASWVQNHQKLTTIVLGSLVALGALAVVVWSLAVATQLLMSPITLIVVGIGLLAIGVIYAYNHFRVFRNVVDALGTFLKTVFILTWKAVSSEVSYFVNVVLPMVTRGLSRMVAFMLNIVAQWHNDWNRVVNTVKSAWSFITSTVSGGVHAAANVISSVLGWITSRWTGAWSSMRRLTGQYLNSIASTISSVASGFGGILYRAGQNIIRGLINGMWSMIGSVSGVISSVVSTIKDHLPWSPAKKGPLSGQGAPEIGGRNIVKLMAQGIAGAQPQVDAAMEHLTGAVRAKQQLAGSANLGAAVAGGLAGGGARGAAGNTVYLTFDLRDSRVMSDRDMDLLVNKIGQQVATRILPAGGVRIRM